MLAPAFAEFQDPNPAPGNGFGDSVVALTTGNVVITSPLDDAGGQDAGAVYLFSGATGQLISTLRGSQSGDQLGSAGVRALTNGNFVVVSPNWDNADVPDAGAVTFGNGVTGIAGMVSATNSLVGALPLDRVGLSVNFPNGVTALANGNYVVRSSFWDRAGVSDVGAVTFGNGTTGIAGVVSEANSLVGSSPGDQVGTTDVDVLANGNYVVSSRDWSGGRGAATFGSGTEGVTGFVSAENSLVGSSAGDYVGDVRALPNGNYVVRTVLWRNGDIAGAGAVTYGSGETGVKGPITAENSLIGSSVYALLSSHLIVLRDSSYLVVSSSWSNGIIRGAGSVTFGSGTAGVVGVISAENSLVGSSTDDGEDLQVVALANGGFVAAFPKWDNGTQRNVGAVVFVRDATELRGIVSAEKSLIGTSPGDEVGGGYVTALTNGNYVIASPQWDSPLAANAGAATFVDGTKGLNGVVSAANSLIGATADDYVGGTPSTIIIGVQALANGNFVVRSPYWNDGTSVDVGAVTFGDGTKGLVGVVRGDNSLTGSQPNDRIGSGLITALPNGNFVVASPLWDDGDRVDVGAATFGNGVTGIAGRVSVTNSLIGNSASDQVASTNGVNVIALTNGNYVVSAPGWDDGSTGDVGSVTFGNGVNGAQGRVNALNSVVGSSPADVTGRPAWAQQNGNYLIVMPSWDNGAIQNAGAVVFGHGTTGARGAVAASNSSIGTAANTGLDISRVVNDYVNQNYYAAFPRDGAGRVRAGSLIDGLSRRWHNASRPNDINNDLYVVAGDALAVINYLNADLPRSVPEDATINQPFGFLDTTGDNEIAPDDALAIINLINGRPSGGMTEGEAAAGLSAPAVDNVLAQSVSDQAHFNALLGIWSADEATDPIVFGTIGRRKLRNR